MKCWHLVAALAIAGCGLNTSSLPSTGRSGEDAGVTASEASSSIAGSPASWPARRRPSRLEKDGGSSDTKDASKPPAGGPTTNDKDAQTDPAQGEPANPSGAPSPSAQPTSGGPSKPGSQAQPPGSSSGHGSSGSNGSNGNGQNGSSPNGGAQDPGAPDAGSSGAHGPNDDGSSDEDEHSDDGDQSGNGDHGNSSGNGDDGDNSGPGSGSNGHGGPSQSDDTVSIIVDLVIAILDLSLGPVRPSEIETLVSSILVLSLAPAELAAESLVAVLDALDDTQICIDHPERCNPLCTNLESDCSACGRDEDCIERIEEMCKVKLPKTCL